MIARYLFDSLNSLLDHYPAVALLGPRQVGKTTLARALAAQRPALYLDLETDAAPGGLNQSLILYHSGVAMFFPPSGVWGRRVARWPY